MARTGGYGLRCWLVAWGTGLGLCILGLAVGWSGAVLSAQDAAPQDGPIHTLHVYANLIQIPVLVLSPYRKPIAPIAPSRFSISIDSGPRFRATHVRPEGNDPLSLAILLDASGAEDQLLAKIDDAIAALAPLSLQPQDHVSIYVLDCSLVQTLKHASARPEDLKRAVDLALEPWTYRKKNRHVHCQQGVHLWDALTLVIGELYRLPGRRVILAVTDGKDQGSKSTWNDARALAQDTGVAIFGMADTDLYFRLYKGVGYEDALNSVCELSGGMVLATNYGRLPQTLKDWMSMLRGRYIVEFPRPSNSTAGRHDFLVTIAKSNAFIRPAGIAIPIADPALLVDPTTVPSDPSQAPVEGTHHVMTPPQ